QVPFLLEQYGLARPALIATIAAISSIGIALGAFSYGHVRARLGITGSLTLILLLLGGGHLLMAGTSQMWLLGCGSLISQVGGGMVVPHFLNLLLDRVEPAAQGRVTGLVYTSHFVGAVLNPLAMAP